MRFRVAKWTFEKSFARIARIARIARVARIARITRIARIEMINMKLEVQISQFGF